VICSYVDVDPRTVTLDAVTQLVPSKILTERNRDGFMECGERGRIDASLRRKADMFVPQSDGRGFVKLGDGG
jgi:hypothetical protein